MTYKEFDHMFDDAVLRERTEAAKTNLIIAIGNALGIDKLLNFVNKLLKGETHESE